MVTRAATFAQLAIYAIKVLKKLHQLYAESTPQERETIADHLQAIYDILRNVAGRGQEPSNLPPMLMLPPPESVAGTLGGVRKQQKQRFQEHSRRLRQNMRQFARAIGQYQSSFTLDEAKAVAWHLNEIRKILSGINRRTRSQ